MTHNHDLMAHIDESNRNSTVIHNGDGDYVDYLLSVPLRLLNDIRVAFYLPTAKGSKGKGKGGKVKSTFDKIHSKNNSPTPSLQHDTTSPRSTSTSSAAATAAATAITVTPSDVNITIGDSHHTNGNSRVQLITHNESSSLSPIAVSHDTKHSTNGSSGISGDEKTYSNNGNGNGNDGHHHRTKSSVAKMKDNKKAFGFWFHTSFIVARHLQYYHIHIYTILYTIPLAYDMYHVLMMNGIVYSVMKLME